jgi:DNA modification methylase
VSKYIEFLKSKITSAPESGFDISDSDMSPILKPHQRDAVKWAVKGGKRALFESFGLGKTLQQLEILRLIKKHDGGKVLTVCPLEVIDEFAEHAEMLNMTWQYCKNKAEVDASTVDIIFTNYERVRDGDIEPSSFTAVSLDEASVLRSYGSKTYQTFLRKFHDVKYKFVATATPSPNNFKELIHYAGYLGIMDTGQALTRFFQRDSTKANNLTLYPHKVEEFWLWLSTWALFITSPEDLGYDATGYDLPPLDVRYHCVTVDHSTAGFDEFGQAKLIRDTTFGLKDVAKEKRESIDTRVPKMLEIIRSDPDAHFILWHDLEAERHAIKKALPEACEIYGSQDDEIRAKHAHGFKKGTIKYLATKPDISGQGCNFQHHCHRAIFVGIGYKFNDFIQAIHRIYRFLQKHNVIIDIIYTESEQAVLDALKLKWKQHELLTDNMRSIIREYGLSSTNAVEKLARTIGIHRRVSKGKSFEVYNNDTVIETASMEANSVDMILTSIPFSNHYEYTPSYNDFGHNENNDRFFEQMDYLSPELLRVLRPGRVFACHVKDRVLFGNATGTGMPTMDPFHADCIHHYQKHGFQYFGMITIVTDVVRENNQTYRLGWTENSKDGTKMGVGCPEYVLLFRKLPSDTSRAYADIPVAKSKEDYRRGRWQIDAHAFWRSSGNRLLTVEELAKIDVEQMQGIYRKYSRETVYSYKEHVELADTLNDSGKLPSSFMVIAPGSWDDDVWDDVNRMLCLNTEQSSKGLEMHVCPLQFDTVDRLIERFTNKGETIYDPFGGLFTVPYRAIKLGRKGKASELNHNYFDDGIKYLKAIEMEMTVPELFDLEELS